MTFAIMTLGCKVNSYETNYMIELLLKNKYKQVLFKEVADIYIINTCTVTNTASNKSLRMIRQVIRKNEDAIIIVVGCLSQTFSSKELIDLGVDIVLGNNQKSLIIDHLNAYLKTKKPIIKVEDITNIEFENMVVSNFNKTRAFIKIQDGCNNYCTYCIIPYARGCLRSKRPEVVIEEVKLLVANGFKEIILTGINIGKYGVDLIDCSLTSLIRELIKIDDLLRIRISSIEVTELNDEFIQLLNESNVIVNQLHIPLQSGSETILKLMNRKYNVMEYENKVNELRKIRPNLLITTDVIVGFPMETEKLFSETMEVLKRIGFYKIHVFPYSKREGTEASLMSEQVDGTIKKERVKKLLKISKQLEIETMEKFLGQVVEIIPETIKDGYLIGHSDNYLLVKVKGNKTLLNELIEIKLESVDYPYLIGHLIDKKT